MSRSDVLSMIDGAINDWETSPDAVRWIPPEKRAEHTAQVAVIVHIDAEQIGRVLRRAFEQMAVAVGRGIVTINRMFGPNPRAVIEWKAAVTRARWTTGPARHGAVKHARDLHRVVLKAEARRYSP